MRNAKHIESSSMSATDIDIFAFCGLRTAFPKTQVIAFDVRKVPPCPPSLHPSIPTASVSLSTSSMWIQCTQPIVVLPIHLGCVEARVVVGCAPWLPTCLPLAGPTQLLIGQQTLCKNTRKTT